MIFCVSLIVFIYTLIKKPDNKKIRDLDFQIDSYDYEMLLAYIKGKKPDTNPEQKKFRVIKNVDNSSIDENVKGAFNRKKVIHIKDEMEELSEPNFEDVISSINSQLCQDLYDIEIEESESNKVRS